MRLFPLLVSICLAPAALAADALTPTDVEQAGGLVGVQRVRYNPRVGASGELNFVGRDGKLVCIAFIRELGWYDAWKKQLGTTADPMPGVGDEGFRAPAGHWFNFVAFKKGKQAVMIQSVGKRGHDKTFSVDQLAQLARTAAKRL